MKLRICGLPAAFVSCLLASAQTLAQNAYITNAGSDTVSVINTATNSVTATVPRRRSIIRRGDDPGGQQGLRHERDQRQRVGDRHGKKRKGDRQVRQRSLRPFRRGGDLQRQRNLHREIRRWTVAVIDTATNKVICPPIRVGNNPVAFGVFIQPH
jgi:YVTN family beta-propeller protein